MGILMREKLKQKGQQEADREGSSLAPVPRGLQLGSRDLSPPHNKLSCCVSLFE